jgi:hypothetical protein
MKPTEKKSLNSPDETRIFPKAKVEMVTVGGVTFWRATLDPGWKWSEHGKPIAMTKSCEQPHILTPEFGPRAHQDG